MMIWIFNLERASAGVCDSYTDVYQYILGLEGQMDIENTHNLNRHAEEPSLTCEVDQKQWCIDFCRNHNFVIIETPSKPVNTEHSPWNSHVHMSGIEERFKQAS
jgi:hypothetical protein